MSYAVPPFLTPERTRLMERLRRAWLPAHLTRTWLASGGSEAVDAACRLAVQHFRAKGDNTRWKIVGRDISYHGTTLFTLGIAGHEARKRGFERLIPDMPLAPTPYALRSPLGRHHPDFDIAAADAFEALVLREGPETIAAFIAEPINGSSGGALMPGPRYWPRIQEICKRHGILLIIDEVMTGFGRTGKAFACEHFDIAPDILVSGKGLAGGYAPIVGVFASEEVVAPLAAGGQSLMFYTYGGHPGACAAADKVLQIMEDEDLVARAAARGRALATRIEACSASIRTLPKFAAKGCCAELKSSATARRSNASPKAPPSRSALSVRPQTRRLLLWRRHGRHPRHRLSRPRLRRFRRRTRPHGRNAESRHRRGRRRRLTPSFPGPS